MAVDEQRALREHVVYLLSGGGAHLGFEDAITDIPAAQQGARVSASTKTPWQLLEHMRICQWDILEFCQNPEHVSPKFPEGYWPTGDAPPSESCWGESVTAFVRDRQQIIDLVMDSNCDLLTPLPHGQGQTLLREALLVADHDAYHLGQLVYVRRMLGIWPE